MLYIAQRAVERDAKLLGDRVAYAVAVALGGK
jgi:hypothetical protein